MWRCCCDRTLRLAPGQAHIAPAGVVIADAGIALLVQGEGGLGGDLAAGMVARSQCIGYNRLERMKVAVHLVQDKSI